MNIALLLIICYPAIAILMSVSLFVMSEDNNDRYNHFYYKIAQFLLQSLPVWSFILPLVIIYTI